MERGLSRRDWLGLAPAVALGGASAVAVEPTRGRAAGRPDNEPFGYCLNTSTVRGDGLTIARKAGLAAEAGYQALEPWINELDEHVRSGRSLDALGREIKDLGLTVESAIGFFEWAVDDDTRRRKAFDEAERNMEMVRRIGGTRLAAPPVGATDRGDMDLKRVAERYRALLELGERTGVVPQVEVWGFSRTLGTLGEAAQVAIAADHRSACILPDVYHLYKGGSGFRGVKLLGRDAFHVFHANDYPASPPRDRITDADRVYPGDGVAPLSDLYRDLKAIGFQGFLSIELFNRAYWKEEPLSVLRKALEKLRATVKGSFAAPTGR